MGNLQNLDACTRVMFRSSGTGRKLNCQCRHSFCGDFYVSLIHNSLTAQQLRQYLYLIQRPTLIALLTKVA